MSQSQPTAILGRTQLAVTRLGFGAMEIRGSRIWGGRPVTEEQASAILNAVLDSGINFIDTANDYGRSEEFIGKTIAHRRREYVLATKCGCKVTYKDETTDETPHDFSRENMLRGLHESLERMKTDVIDIMQLHNPPVEIATQENVVETLNLMKQQGKVRFTSISTTLPHLPTYLEWGVFDTFQIPYSALEREHEDWIRRSAQAGIGTIIRGGVARGEPGVGSEARRAGKNTRRQTWMICASRVKAGPLSCCGLPSPIRTSTPSSLARSSPTTCTKISPQLNAAHFPPRFMQRLKSAWMRLG